MGLPVGSAICVTPALISLLFPTALLRISPILNSAILPSILDNGV